MLTLILVIVFIGVHKYNIQLIYHIIGITNELHSLVGDELLNDEKVYADIAYVKGCQRELLYTYAIVLFAVIAEVKLIV